MSGMPEMYDVTTWPEDDDPESLAGEDDGDSRLSSAGLLFMPEEADRA